MEGKGGREGKTDINVSVGPSASILSINSPHASHAKRDVCVGAFA